MSTAARSILAYSSDGRVLAIAQERELLVYSGTDGSPLWRSECDANIVAVGVHSQFIFALDTGDGNIIDFSKPDGRIVRNDPHQGRPLNRWLLNVSILPRPQEAGQEAEGASPGSKGAAIPAWAGPLVGPAVGFLIGMQLSRDLKADAAATLTITATLIGFVGGGLMWLIDLFKGK
jgi:hypothetical protein